MGVSRLISKLRTGKQESSSSTQEQAFRGLMRGRNLREKKGVVGKLNGHNMQEITQLGVPAMVVSLLFYLLYINRNYPHKSTGKNHGRTL